MIRRRDLSLALAAVCVRDHERACGDLHLDRRRRARRTTRRICRGVPAEQRGEARQRAADAERGAEQGAGASRARPLRRRRAPAVARRSARAGRGAAGASTGFRSSARARGMIVLVRLNGRRRRSVPGGHGRELRADSRAPSRRRPAIEIGPDTRTMRFSTANGVVEHPIVMLDLVELGSAQAEEVPPAITPTHGDRPARSLVPQPLHLSGRCGQRRAHADRERSRRDAAPARRSLRESQWRSEFAACARARRRSKRVATARRRAARVAGRTRRAAGRATPSRAARRRGRRGRVPDVWRRSDRSAPRRVVGFSQMRAIIHGGRDACRTRHVQLARLRADGGPLPASLAHRRCEAPFLLAPAGHALPSRFPRAPRSRPHRARPRSARRRAPERATRCPPSRSDRADALRGRLPGSAGRDRSSRTTCTSGDAARRAQRARPTRRSSACSASSATR